MSTVVLLSSPALGPAAWQPVAERLRGSGTRVLIPAWTAPVRTPTDVVDQVLAQLPDDEELVLVPHSNAGLYVAALAALRRVTGLVLVDAGIPSAVSTPTAAAAFREFLASLADQEGMLPPWTRWWPPADVVGLFPDTATRARVEQDQPRLPLGYFDAEVPAPSGWEALPGAYLGFGDAYAEEQELARARGWPVQTLPGRHLHQLVDPAGVTAALTRLCRRL